MSKTMLVFLLLVSATVYDPQRVIALFGPHVQLYGGKLASTLDLNHALPRLARR